MDSLKGLEQNLRILRLKGTREERARQHGEVIAQLHEPQRRELAITPLSGKNQLLLDRAGGRIPGSGRLMKGLYEALVWERFLHLPKTYRNRIAPFVEVSGFSKKQLWLALYQPDFLMVLAATATPKTRRHFLQGLPGCSTVRVFARDGVRWIRNLDYPAASYWEKNPAVCYHDPSEPGHLKHVSITSLGIPTSGLTGWNEAGIAISLHAHFSKKVSLSGAPIFFLGEDILENASTLEDALRWCRDFKPMGSWALNLSSFKENLHVTVELVGGKIAVRYPESASGIAHTNHFQHPEFQRDELDFCPDFLKDCEARKTAMEVLAESLAGDFHWKQALLNLSNHRENGTQERRIFGNTASVITTIQTVGFDPVEDSLYLSVRPESPVTHGPYIQLPREPDLKQGGVAPQLLDLGHPHPPEFMRALHHFHQAYVAWQVRGEKPEVPHAYLLEAVRAWPEDPHLLMQLGYFELMAGQPKEAMSRFDQAHSRPGLTSHHQDICQYFRGAALDLLGEREQAIRSYQRVTGRAGAEEALVKKAKKRLNRPFTVSDTRRIEPDLQFVEPLNYS